MGGLWWSRERHSSINLTKGVLLESKVSQIEWDGIGETDSTVVG